MSSRERVARLLLVIAGVSSVVFLVAVGAHEYHYSFEPYRWVAPDAPSELSRSLWLDRRDAYRATGFISFSVAAASGASGFFLRRHGKLP
ncbi:MAG TPA: hypothetical protein VGB73_10985 [Pyrinomonadaceae bacterium]